MRKKIGVFLTILMLLGLFGCFTKESIQEGGVVTDRTNNDAPKEIVSQDIESFSADFYIRDGIDFNRTGAYSYKITKKEDSIFVLESDGVYSHKMEISKEQVMEVQEIFEKYGLVQYNGIYKVTQGLPQEFQPMSLSVTYESGETFEYCVNCDPEAAWTIAFRNYFDSLFTDAGFADTKPSKEAFEITDFEMKFNEGDLGFRYGFLIDFNGQKCFEFSTYNRNTGESLSKRAQIANDFLAKLSEEIEICKIKGYCSQLPRESTDYYFEIRVNYANERQIFGKFSDDKIPDEWEAAKESIRKFLDEYIEDNIL